MRSACKITLLSERYRQLEAQEWSLLSTVADWGCNNWTWRTSSQYGDGPVSYTETAAIKFHIADSLTTEFEFEFSWPSAEDSQVTDRSASSTSAITYQLFQTHYDAPPHFIRTYRATLSVLLLDKLPLVIICSIIFNASYSSPFLSHTGVDYCLSFRANCSYIDRGWLSMERAL